MWVEVFITNHLSTENIESSEDTKPTSDIPIKYK